MSSLAGLSETPHALTSDAWLMHAATSAGAHGPVNQEASSLHPGAIVDGKYLLGALLGYGGMGWVFDATHLQTGNGVALKYLRPGLRGSEVCIARFAQEARATCRIDHPNVIRAYESGGEGADLYIVMERLHGETLRARLNRGPVDAQAAIELMLAVMRGVAEAHRHNIVHRDLKPENIFLPRLLDGTYDQPKILDFGVSTATDCSHVGTTRPASTEYKTAAGTPHYMPLEQLRGQRVDERADVYALGVVLYELLGGARPFYARNREDLATKIATEVPAPVRSHCKSVSAVLDFVTMRALAREPRDRYPSVTSFARALAAAVPVYDPRSPGVVARLSRWRLIAEHLHRSGFEQFVW